MIMKRENDKTPKKKLSAKRVNIKELVNDPYNLQK